MVEIPTVVLLCLFQGLVAGLLRPRLFSSKLSKLKAAEKYSGSATITQLWGFLQYPSLTEPSSIE